MMDDLSRRMLLLSSAALLAGVAARQGVRAQARTQDERAVSDFDSVLWEAAGELSIRQTNRERLVIDAEPAVIAKVVTEVDRRRLRIGFRPGTVQSREPIRFFLEVKELVSMQTRSSGVVHVGPLSTNALTLHSAGSEQIELAQLHAQALDVRLDGAGEVAVDGDVERQRVVIAGAANYRASGLASRHAEVAIDGSGDVRVAVAERLVIRIRGSGSVIYRGNPQVLPTVSGAGDIRREDER